MYTKLTVYFARLFNSIFRNSGVYVRYAGHNVLSTYYKNPPVNYVLKQFSTLNHYINDIPLDNRKPFIIEFEHLLFMSGVSRDYKKMIDSVNNSLVILESDLCKAIIVWSNGTIREMEKYIDISSIEHKIHLVRPASDPIKSNQKKDQDTFRILNIGNKFWVKGTFAAIQAFNKFNKNHPETKFTIACNDVPNSFNISDNIEIINTPMLSSERKNYLFNKADVFLFPCLHDSYGVYIEALAYALPMISSHIFDKAEIIIDNKCGYLIEPPFSLYEHNIGLDYKDYDEFVSLIQKKYSNGEFEEMINKMVEKLEYLYNNKEVLQEMGANCHNHLVDTFSIEERNLRLTEIYTNILKDL